MDDPRSTDPLSWGEAERLYFEARRLLPRDRAPHVEAAAGGDPELRKEVLSLLEHGEEAEAFFGHLREGVLSRPPWEGEGHGPAGETPSPPLPQLPAGATVGRYRILERVGSGGMGTVYRAYDPALDREVALKVLPPHLTLDRGARERFLVEARAAAALDHPNVCTIHEVGEEDGRSFLAMALYQGETLQARLARDPLDVDEAVRIAVQLARGLGTAHARRIVHRDVKPGNVMLTPDGTVKLLDFGIAKVVDLTLTRPGLTVGTVAYMSPEQASGDRVDHRSDLFSLGVVLYEMLARVRPFRGDRYWAVVYAIRHEEPEPLRTLRPEVSESVARVVERLLRKNPEERYGSAEELLADLSPSGSAPALDPGRAGEDRSITPVLGIYLLASGMIFLVAVGLTRLVGLPGWVPSVSAFLLLVGLPIITATALVQGGRRARAGKSFLPRQLTWRRAIGGGVGAFSLLGILTAAYLVSRATGIGPAGSLLARGELAEGDRIVLTDFRAPADDPTLGTVVAHALRIDLLETPLFRVLDSSEIREVLGRMQVAADAPLTPELAREVALREGVKAVLAGEVARAGAGYVLTASLRHAESDRSLAAFRETARNADELIPAIDRLSRRVRERIGESLRSIRAGPTLETVTTSSLEALRLYVGADGAIAGGEVGRGLSLLEEAVERDPDFAMAWASLGHTLANLAQDPARRREAFTRAFELRDRLGERERHTVAASYLWTVTRDHRAASEAARRVLDIDPDDAWALTILGRLSDQSGEFGDAAGFYQRAVERSVGGAPLGGVLIPFANLIRSLLSAGRLEEARSWLEVFDARYPGHPAGPELGFWVSFHSGDEAGARARVELLRAERELPPYFRARAHHRMALLALWRGRVGEAREHLEAAERIAGEGDASFQWRQRLETAWAEVQVGDRGRAVEIVLEGRRDGTMDSVPAEGRAYPSQAEILGLAERTDEVEALIRRYEEDVPAESRGPLAENQMNAARGFVLLQRGDAEGAVRLLREARAALACRVCFARAMGWALREAARPQEAASEWETLAGMNGVYVDEGHLRHLWATERLGPLYEELGDPERALVHYRRFVELWGEADPELQPRVRHARERIAALGGG